MNNFNNNKDAFKNIDSSFNKARGKGAKAGSENPKALSSSMPPPPGGPKSNEEKSNTPFFIFLGIFFILCAIMCIVPQNEIISNIAFIALVLLGLLAILYSGRIFHSKESIFFTLFAGIICLTVVFGVFKPKTIIIDLYNIAKKKGEGTGSKPSDKKDKP